MKNTSARIKILLSLSILLVVGLACDDTAPKESSSQVADANIPAVVIDARTLVAEYKNNEVAANAKYQGKKLEVTGIVDNISDTMGSITVSLRGGGNFELVNVICGFSDASGVASLNKGQKATLVGIGDGMTAGLYVGLESCAVK